MAPGCIVEYKVFSANIRSLTSQAESPPSCPTPRHHRARVLGSEPLDRSEEPQCWAELGARGGWEWAVTHTQLLEAGTGDQA